jgi:hypothetical protein
MSQVSEKMVSDEIVSLLTRCLDKVTHASNAVAPRDGDPPGRLFFPAGIELIYIKFNLGKADVTFALAGPNAKYPASTSVTANSAVVGDASRNQSIPSTHK